MVAAPGGQRDEELTVGKKEADKKKMSNYYLEEILAKISTLSLFSTDAGVLKWS